jgi:type I restriction enzyme S subunit
LADIASFQRGVSITEKQTAPGPIPVVANGPDVVYMHDTANRTGETVVVARSGAHAGSISYWNEPIFLTDAFSVHPDERSLRPRFLYHYLFSRQRTIKASKKGAGVPHVRARELARFPVPVPPLVEQDRIVSILDKFDALVNDLSVGLPAELAARRRQYEYFRDRLLSFEEAA